jgi:hypothetical protein
MDSLSELSEAGARILGEQHNRSISSVLGDGYDDLFGYGRGGVGTDVVHVLMATGALLAIYHPKVTMGTVLVIGGLLGSVLWTRGQSVATRRP